MAWYHRMLMDEKKWYFVPVILLLVFAPLLLLEILADFVEYRCPWWVIYIPSALAAIVWVVARIVLGLKGKWS